MDTATVTQMFTGETLLIVTNVVFLLVAIMLGFSLYRSKKQINYQMFLDAATITEKLVASAEQLWVTGKLERGQRFDWVAAKVRVLFPKYTDDQISELIDGGVGWLKALSGVQAKPQP